ncbi:MAG: 2,3-bisphosphoglycerate-independent phosphoglycerate mutase [Oscillospiraceae bacterium]|nr:2,3-bisphosphoglycerate-independent phosphoglycerate mutase [Oscillospiraceae bacterium]
MKKPLVLMILDGYGESKDSYGNAVLTADTPYLDNLRLKWPSTLISASGLDVGLPDGQMGNSEVGHTNIGAGRIVYQDLTRISKAIEDGDFYKNPVLLKAMSNASGDSKHSLHLMGLLSDGGVHSHIEHIIALVKMAKLNDVKDVYLHLILDGRDVPPHSGIEFVADLRQRLDEIGVGEIATISGRYYAMDRDNRWDRVEKAYDAFVFRKGIIESDPIKAIRDSYENNITDEFVLPIVVNPDCRIKENDSFIFFNFRPDRAREITRTFVDPAFSDFDRKIDFFKLFYVCMTEYDVTMPNVDVAFPLQSLVNTFGEYISENNLTQLRIAETEKYAHVTFFFNGGREAPFVGEDRILVPSPKVATYDLKPEMSAFDVKDKLVEAIQTNQYDFIICNYANGDMVGHTGIYVAIEQAVIAIDACLNSTIEMAKENDYEVIIISDHGNADNALNEDGSPNTAHSLNPVPFVYVTSNLSAKVTNGMLADVAPSLLHIMGLKQPNEMTGENLISIELD